MRELELQHAQHARIERIGRERAVCERLLHGRDRTGHVADLKQHVVAGGEGAHGLLPVGILREGLHLQPVRDDDAAETEVIAQQVRDELVREGRGHIVHRRHGQVADHDHVRPGGDAGDEGLEVLLPQLRERLIDRGGAVVRVRGRTAVAGEMLQTADDPGVTKAVHGGGDERGRLVIIIAVGAVADGVAALVRPDIGHGRKVGVEAVGRDVVREGLGIVIRALRAETAVAVHAV